MKKTTLIVGNWKLNPQTQAEAVTLVAHITKKYKAREGVLVEIAPSFVYLAEVGKKIGKKEIFLAAQNLSAEPMGAFTGEVSAAQLRDIKADYVIIGHSERRVAGETDEQVQKKVSQALKHNLTPIICIGEKERDSQGNFFTFIESQVKAIAVVLPAAQIKKVV